MSVANADHYTSKVRNAGPIFQFADGLPNTVVLNQRPEWNDDVLIIAGDWNRPCQNVLTRPLIITRIPDEFGNVSCHFLEVKGTPPRGTLIVPRSPFEDVAPVGRMSQSTKTIKWTKAKQLRRFCDELAAIAWPKAKESAA